MANNNFFDNLFSEYLSTTAAQPTVPLSELLGPVEYAPIPGWIQASSPGFFG